MKKVEVSELRGPLIELMDQIGGQNGRERFDEFKLWLKSVSIVQQLPIWKTVKLGTGPITADNFRRVINNAGQKVGDWANGILDKSVFKVSKTTVSVDLVVLAVAELGFNDGARYDQICARAKELGLELCPNEVGPQLRLQYTDQPVTELIIVAMEPIADSQGHLFVFGVVRNFDGTWLYGYRGNPGYFWRADSRFVFVRCRAD